MTQYYLKNLYHKTPKVLLSSNGTILKVLRLYDNAEIYVGMETKSGGKILRIVNYNQLIGGMAAEIGKPFSFVSIACISL